MSFGAGAPLLSRAFVFYGQNFHLPATEFLSSPARGYVFSRQITMPLTEKDRLLINNLLSGKAGTWEMFVDRYSGLIVHVLRHTAHSHSLQLSDEDIDDLTADVFATLLERDMGAIRGFRGRSSFATYLTVIVRRVLLRKLTQRRYMAAFGHVRVHQSSVADAADHSAEVEIDDKDEVESLMVRLPEPVRAMVTLFFQGKSYREISQQLGMPVNSIGPALARAKLVLKEFASPSSTSSQS